MSLAEIAARNTPLALVLARSLAGTRGSDTRRLATLNRIYSGLSWQDRLKCRAALARCKIARRMTP